MHHKWHQGAAELPPCVFSPSKLRFPLPPPPTHPHTDTLTHNLTQCSNHAKNTNGEERVTLKGVVFILHVAYGDEVEHTYAEAEVESMFFFLHSISKCGMTYKTHISVYFKSPLLGENSKSEKSYFEHSQNTILY